jgi:hypothetical protein
MPRSNVWMLLPEAPAFSPIMREKFKIKTVKKMFLTYPWIVKDGFKIDHGVRSNLFPENSNTESVVGTYSYSSEEFVDMFVFNAFSQAGDSTGINTHLVKYLVQEYNVKPSFVLDSIFKQFIMVPNNWTNRSLGDKIHNIYTTMYNWVHGSVNQNGFDYHKDFPLILPIHMYFPFLILMNTSDFYNEICEFLSEKFNDQKILDLGKFLTNAIIDISYDPKLGRKFTTNYNWLHYFQTGNLEYGTFNFDIADKTVYTNGSYLPIDWYEFSTNYLDIAKQFVYKQLGDITIQKISTTIKLT